MLRGKGFFILLIVTALAVVGATANLKRESPQPEVGALVFPALLDRVNEITVVNVTSGGDRFDVVREGNAWVAPARDGHPVLPDKVHRLLVGAAGLERLEPKTSDPKRFAELGLRDPGAKESRAVRFEMRAGDADPLAALIVGERRPAKGDPSRTEYFVRVPGEERSWLVRGTLPHDADGVVDWLDKRIARIADDRVVRVRVTHADGEVVTALRKPAGESGYRYQQLPEGASVKDPWRVNDLGQLLADLEFDEVRRGAEGEPGAAQAVVEAETSDGLRVSLRLYRDGAGSADGEEAGSLARLSAAFDPALAAARPDGAPDEAAVRQEVQTLNARWQPWVYVVPRFKADTMGYRQADLVPPESEPSG